MVTILTNADIYTMDERNPRAKTIVYDGAKILYVGSNEAEWKPMAGEKARIYNLGGKMVIPGFVDSHCHPGHIAKTVWHVRLPYTEDVTELLGFMKEYAEKHPASEKPFLFFEYYPTHIFDEKGPRKEMLDEIIADRPVLVQDYGEHMSWVNSKTLELMGVTRDTPDPEPGYRMFVRDSDGTPTGFVLEFAWKCFEETLYENLQWRPPDEITEDALKMVLDQYMEYGVTAIFDAFVETERQLISMKTLDEKGDSMLYYDGAVLCDSLDLLDEKIAELGRFRETFGNDHMKFNTMKLFLDGTNESGSGGYLHPIINDDSGENYGNTTLNDADLFQYMKKVNEAGLDLHVHVVGDRSFRMLCDAYEKLMDEVGRDNLKTQLVIAHCELVDPADMYRPAELGITINYTLRWSGGNYGEKAKLYLGEERWNRFYTFSPMIKSGALIAFSSDLIAYSKMRLSNPFVGMQISHTRVDMDTPLDPRRFPESVRPPVSEKFDRALMLKGYTINSAKQMRWDHIMGSLEAGKLANINVLSENYFDVPADKIGQIKCAATIFEGKVVRGSLDD